MHTIFFIAIEKKKYRYLYSEDVAFHGQKTLQCKNTISIIGLIKRSKMSDQSPVKKKKKANADGTAICIIHSLVNTKE